jgi:hypothetical protein
VGENLNGQTIQALTSRAGGGAYSFVSLDLATTYHSILMTDSWRLKFVPVKSLLYINILSVSREIYSAEIRKKMGPETRLTTINDAVASEVDMTGKSAGDGFWCRIQVFIVKPHDAIETKISGDLERARRALGSGPTPFAEIGRFTLALDMLWRSQSSRLNRFWTELHSGDFR